MRDGYVTVLIDKTDPLLCVCMRRIAVGIMRWRSGDGKRFTAVIQMCKGDKATRCFETEKAKNCASVYEVIWECQRSRQPFPHALWHLFSHPSLRSTNAYMYHRNCKWTVRPYDQQNCLSEFESPAFCLFVVVRYVRLLTDLRFLKTCPFCLDFLTFYSVQWNLPCDR